MASSSSFSQADYVRGGRPRRPTTSRTRRLPVVAAPVPDARYASTSVQCRNSFTTKRAAPTTPSPAVNCSFPAALALTSSSWAAAPTRPTPQARARPRAFSSSTGTSATFSSSISATGGAVSREIFAPLSTTPVPPSMTVLPGATPPLGSMASSAPTSSSSSSSVHAQTNAYATDQAEAGPASSFPPAVWPSEWWPNPGDMFAMPFTEENEELQDGGIQEDDDAERLELMRSSCRFVRLDPCLPRVAALPRGRSALRSAPRVPPRRLASTFRAAGFGCVASPSAPACRSAPRVPPPTPRVAACPSAPAARLPLCVAAPTPRVVAPTPARLLSASQALLRLQIGPPALLDRSSSLISI
nr:formin-like protein 6 [Lolium perenne]